MKLTIEGKSDEIKTIFGDAVINKNVNDEDKIKKVLNENLDEIAAKMAKQVGYM